MSATTRLPLLRRSLHESWRSLIGWSVGLVAALSLYLPLFPSLGGSSGMQQLIHQLPSELVNTLGYNNIFTGSGYAQTTFFGLMGFLLFSIAGIGWGTASIAGDEERGTLELTLAHGVSRTQLVLERVASIVVRIGALGLVTLATVLILNGPSNLKLSAGNVLSGVIALCGVALLFACASLAVGATSGRRTWALLGGTFVAVVGYVFNAVGNQTQSVEWLKSFSPYSWAFRNQPLTNGWDLGGLALIYGGGILLVLVAVITFNRRDVGR
ncbi:ABC transporter permease subunit [Lysinibacter sp. HNR]|uniref:ABC transporter permease subunit n=1 Tax=Lysinibacter sp. HNR TaxID=3031408 RepID=UPI00243490A6|nr:ABC transporter permease subunit [Lysinibacter sp. HNR]WGD36522.1 ABC transporter permease subunit [Lysinibacter sp. HNR]